MKSKLPGWIGALLLLALAVTLKSSHLPVITDLQLKIFDFYQVIAPRHYTDAPVRIVDIDDESLNKIGQWPWPRTTLAQLVNRLHEAGVASVALDIVFPESDRTSPSHMLTLWNVKESDVPALKNLPNHDAVFAQAIKEAPVVTGFVLTHQYHGVPMVKSGFSYAGDDPLPYVTAFSAGVANIKPLEEGASGNGALNSNPDRDGILRSIPLIYRIGNQLYPALSMEALRVAQGARGYTIKTVGASDEMAGLSAKRGLTAIKVGHFQVPTDSAGRFWLYYTEHVQSRYIPAWKVLDGSIAKEQLEGSIILVGTTAAGLKDLRSTPLNPSVGGVEVHAQAIEQIMHGVFLSRPDWIEGAEIILMALTGLLVILVISRLSALWAAAFMVAALGLAFTCSWYAFKVERLLIEPVMPSIVILLLYFWETVRRHRRTEQEKSRIRDAFNLYMSPALVDELAEHPERLKLGGENREVTVMFSDIREFSGISEKLPPVELTRFINSFLTPMTDVIMRHNGTIDKYIGDCIMAMWNAPVYVSDHPKSAARAALAMRDALAEFNARMMTEDTEVPLPVRVGMGINTGECCVGNMGSAVRFEYSVLGNEVDMAARLESQCKTYGVDIILGPATQAHLPEFATLELDLIQVKGKTVPARIFALLGDEKLAGTAAYKVLAAAHRTLIEAYRAGAWNDAMALLEECRRLSEGDLFTRMAGCYMLYDARIVEFHRNPPPSGWNGVYEATTK